ncbi:MAG: metallophosphoesterase [Pseudomonadota bacterium]
MHSDKRDGWRRRRREMEGDDRRYTPAGPRREPAWGRVVDGPLGWVAERLLPGGKANALDIRLNAVDIHLPGLPSGLDGFSILHLSDLHPANLPPTMDRAVELLRGVTADLAVLTGDFQTHGRPGAGATARALAPVLASLETRHGTVAVLGNHDRHDMADALAGLGVRVLVNEHLVVDHGGARLVLTGTDDANRFYTEAAAAALRSAPHGFRVALVHSPDLAAAAEASGHALYLTGHTHGGQVCLPGGVPVVTASDAPRRLASGRWRLGAMEGYTSRGVGVGRPPLRYNCRGEIARIVLSACEAPTDGPADGRPRHRRPRS